MKQVESIKQRELRYKRFKRTMKRDARIRLQNQKLRGQLKKIEKLEDYETR